MHIKRLIINQFLGVEEFDITPGKVVRIEGRNESGKSSVLHGIKTALGHGETAELLRHGASEGQIVLVLDDDKTIKRKFDASGKDTTTIKDPERGTIPKPATYLKKLADILSVNPLRFLLADDKTRAKYLIEAMDIKLSDADKKALEKAGIKADSIAFVDDHLGWLNSARKELFEKRTDVKRYRGEQAVMVKNMEESLPVDKPADAETLKGLEKEEARIRSERDSEIMVVKQHYADTVEQAAKIRDSAIERIQSDYEKKLTPASNAVAIAKEQLESAGRIKQQRKTFEEAKAKRDELDTKVTTLDKQIDAIDTLKERIMANLPIKGVEVRDGDIYVDDTPWTDINTARRIEVMFDLGAIRMSDLKVMTLDDAEHLDSESMAEIVRQAEERGIQLFVASVKDTDFTIS